MGKECSRCATRVETVQLLTPEEVDAAAQRTVSSRAPGE